VNLLADTAHESRNAISFVAEFRLKICNYAAAKIATIIAAILSVNLLPKAMIGIFPSSGPCLSSLHYVGYDTAKTTCALCDMSASAEVDFLPVCSHFALIGQRNLPNSLIMSGSTRTGIDVFPKHPSGMHGRRPWGRVKNRYERLTLSNPISLRSRWVLIPVLGVMVGGMGTKKRPRRWGPHIREKVRGLGLEPRIRLL